MNFQTQFQVIIFLNIYLMKKLLRIFFIIENNFLKLNNNLKII
jgi:hypothetical protein